MQNFKPEPGTLEHWNTGTPEHWNNETPEPGTPLIAIFTEKTFPCSFPVNKPSIFYINLLKTIV
jgi:hypothetical protein